MIEAASNSKIELDLVLREGLPAAEAFECVKRGLRHGDAAARYTAFHLSRMARDKAWEQLGYSNLAMLAGALKRSVSTLEGYIRVGKGLDEFRRVDAGLVAGRYTYSHVVHLLPILVEETEEEWVEAAASMSSRALGKLTAKKVKGDRPGDPDRRGSIHTMKVSHTLRLTVTQNEVARRSLMKACAEAGCRLTFRELFLELCRRYLLTEPDGTVPGWKRVHADHYLIHATPASGGDPDRLVVRDEHGEEVEISRGELVSSPFQAAALARAGEPREPLTVELRWRELDPDNSGPELAPELRAPPTSAALRDKVLARDGHRCVVCGRQRNLSAHHVHWRRYGGRTVASNLVTLCEDCHSMVHDRLLILLVDPVHGLRKLGPDGRPLSAQPEEPLPFQVVPPPAPAGEAASPEPAGEAASPEPAAAAAPPAPPAAAAPPAPEQQLVSLSTLPESVDLDWLRRHAHLIGWNERQGVLELTPGFVRRGGADPAPETEAPQLRLGDLVGQPGLRERLAVAIEGSKRLGEGLEHLLFTGPPGQGKSTLAEAVAGELGAGLVRLPAPLVKSPEVLLRRLMGLRAGEVVFVDELHALPQRLAEVLYEALDRNALSLPIREAESPAGLGQRTLRIRLPAFTLIGATTEPNLVPRPLASRLRAEKLEPWSADELVEVVMRAAREKGLALAREAAVRLVGASRESPRRALSLLREARQEAAVSATSTIDLALVEQTLARREIDARGFDPVDRRILAVLREARGRAISLRALAARVGETEAEIRELREPWLERAGLVRTTPRGRVLPGCLPGGRPESN